MDIISFFFSFDSAWRMELPVHQSILIPIYPEDGCIRNLRNPGFFIKCYIILGLFNCIRYSLFYSVALSQCMYNSRIIRCLHYYMFRPLFLHSHSELSLLFPFHRPMFTTGGRACYYLECRFLFLDFKSTTKNPHHK